jgi:hypothetical protein
MRFNPLRLLLPAALVVGCAAVFSAGGSAAGQAGELAKPSALQTFLHIPPTGQLESASEVEGPYPRTPAFAWSPVRGATHYQFQLSTRPDFLADNAIVWSGTTSSPTASVPLALPWITGPSFWWRVRAFGPRSFSPWSSPKAFDMRWLQKPQKWPGGDHPGYIRWSMVDGATAYQVWFQNVGSKHAQVKLGSSFTPTRVGLGKVFTTITNVADEREYYQPGKPKSVEWRVRAERRVYGARKNGLPAVSFGPWSNVYTSPVSAVPSSAAPLQPVTAISDVVSTRGDWKPPHALVPAFAMNESPTFPATLYRVYLYTDRDCVNRVFTGYPVASPAYAPRSTGGAVLPKGPNRMADGTNVTPNEVAKGAPAKVDLWDNLGRYYAVAVPVVEIKNGGKVVYQDQVLPQDVCTNGHFLNFRKSSTAPAVTSHGDPWASGLSPNGRLVAAHSWKQSFYGAPLVTWQPAPGAVGYEVQWSKSADPWRTAGSIHTAATAASLPLKPGTWWYRVRGVNPSLPGSGLMSWSAQLPLQITRPTFGVVGS